MSIARALPVFSIAFAVIYVASVQYNLAVITYHPQLAQWGLLVEAPEATIATLTEEHAVVHGVETDLAVGDLVRVIPNHVCSVVNLTSELVVVSNGTVTDRWPVSARRLPQKPMLSGPVRRPPASASGWSVTTLVSVIGSTLVSRFAILSRTALTVVGVKQSGIPASLPQSLVA